MKKLLSNNATIIIKIKKQTKYNKIYYYNKQPQQQNYSNEMNKIYIHTYIFLAFKRIQNKTKRNTKKIYEKQENRNQYCQP